DTAEQGLTDALRADGLEAQVAKAKPNLEDVFVAATRGQTPRAATAREEGA
ncbi:hypothetical protein CATMIT_01688, partial [Catenibacterium mitsuokai DSM 15897]